MTTATVAPWTNRHVVYRLFDADGMCIYVGMTRAFDSRIAHHIQTEPYGSDVAKVKVTVHPSKEIALAVEAAEILARRPRYNIYGRGPRISWSACDYTEVIQRRDQLRARATRPEWHDAQTNRLIGEFGRRFPEIAGHVGFKQRRAA